MFGFHGLLEFQELDIELCLVPILVVPRNTFIVVLQESPNIPINIWVLGIFQSSDKNTIHIFLLLSSLNIAILSKYDAYTI